MIALSDNRIAGLEEFLVEDENGDYRLSSIECGYFDSNWTWIVRTFEVDLLEEYNATV